MRGNDQEGSEKGADVNSFVHNIKDAETGRESKATGSRFEREPAVPEDEFLEVMTLFNVVKECAKGESRTEAMLAEFQLSNRMEYGKQTGQTYSGS